MAPAAMDRLAELRSRTPIMVEHLRTVVEAESPSHETDLTAACARVLSEIGAELLGGEPDVRLLGGRPHLLWTFGSAVRVLLVGHLDTVWPRGTIERWPFTFDGDRASGPGAFDMKSGIVQGLHGLSTLSTLDGVGVLLTSDEELGSQTSEGLIRELASSAQAALILEPAVDGALKTGRKGVSMYTIEIAGKAAHAGLEPERGANALVELAHQVMALREIAAPAAGTTVTPTVARAGSATNVVPAEATIHLDVRASSIAEQRRVHEALHSLSAQIEGTTVRVSGEPNRPPLETSASAALFERASRLAEELGLGPIRGAAVGGASDGNFTAAEGCPTLDGLGGVGAGAHAEGEYVAVDQMAERASLVAYLVEDLLATGRS